MLRLKEVELLGFKSFADRTRLVCDGGTAAVVGPNGCGKSNLADAVSWVLGEQSARVLRGERMSDVIFNGAGSRPPTGMAEVSMTLAETSDFAVASDDLEKMIGLGEGSGAGVPPVGAHGQDAHATGDHRQDARATLRSGDEIKITRRLFRSGESEYLLNGELCRLRDIQDIFMGTGLGPESYAIIEQGRIGQILSSKPSDRRSIIEEAAGVSKFKSRKRLAEAKLESSRQNLSRINDILEEISKQVNSLKRQASKAARYKEMHQELRERQTRVFASRLIALESESESLARRLSAAQAECNESAVALETLERGRASAAVRYENLEQELKRLRDAMAESDLESERARSREEKAREQAAALEARSVEIEDEQRRLGSRAETLAQEAELRAQRAAAVRREWTGAQGVAEKLGGQQAALAEALASKEATVDARREEALEAAGRASELRNQAVKAEEMSLSAAREIARVEAGRAAAEEEFRRLNSESESLRAAHSETESRLAELMRALGETRATLDENRKQEEAARAESERLGRESSQASARRQAVEEALARHAYSTDSVRRLLSASGGENGFHPLGVLADFVEVSPGYEEAVEEFLKAELDCIVVERHEDARKGIALLEREGSGRSTFFVRGGDARIESEKPDGPPDVAQRPGVAAPLAAVLHFEAKLGVDAAALFPEIARSFLLEDSAAAERLAAEFPSCHFITRRGEHYHHRYVSGGKVSSAGPLALRRDFRELDRRASELSLAASESQCAVAAARERLARSEEALRQLSGDQTIIEKQALLNREKLRQADEAAGRAGAQISSLGAEASLLTGEREKADSLRNDLRIQLEAAQIEQQRRATEVAEGVEAGRRLRLDLDELNRALTAARVEASTLEERVNSAEAERVRVEAECAEARERLARMLNQSVEWAEERHRLEEQATTARVALDALAVRQVELRAELQERQAESAGARAQRDELNPQVDAARARVEAGREGRSGIEVSQARVDSDLDHHRQQCRDELGLETEALRAEAAARGAFEGEALVAAETETHELKARIERLGPVNMMALEELQEAEERLSFLDGQRQDLLASINDTTQTIREIDAASHRKFTEAFKAINEFFAEAFRTLFGGGVGEMRFSDDADPESGIELVAQPPGKRLQNVLLLSGGEKALTALALLIGVFRFSPSPFCILDEVDAPLDESNVLRFVRMIQRMSEQTQFILITHNKRTMEACQIMYGVTMEEAGVSRLVSVRFEERERDAQALEAVASGNL